MRKTLYVECGLPATLVPCEFLGWTPTPGHSVTGAFNATVRLKRNAPGYSKGEVRRIPAWSVVNKAGIRNYHIMVRPAELPTRTESNTLPSPY